MPKNKKLVSPVKPTDELPVTAEAKRRKRKNLTIVVASAILAVIIGVSFLGWWLVYKKPLLASIATINGRQISVDYILRRCLWSITDASTGNTSGTASPLSVIQDVIQDTLIEQVAAKPPYNITVSDADIDKALRDQANTAMSSTSTPVTLSESEFREWYRQTLNISQLSDKEFREYVKIRVMSQRLNQYLADRMSYNVDQVHIYDIVVNDGTLANDIKTRIDNGEDFQTIAKELSQDSDTQPKGGDMGWVPVDVLKSIDMVIGNTADTLEIGKVSYPVQLSSAQSSSSDGSDQPYYLFLVTERDKTKLVEDANYIAVLKNELIKNWINEQMSPGSTNVVTLHGRGQSGGYDSTTNAWILYQIENLKHSRGIKDATTTTTANPLTGQ
jgi:foldase protein PrsA